MAVAFNGEISRQDLRRALTLALRPRRMWVRARVVTGVILFTLLVLSLALAPQAAVSALPIYVLFGLLLLMPWWYPFLVAGGQWRVNKSLHGPISGLVDEHGVQLKGVQSESRVRWPGWVQFKVGSDILLLYSSPTIFHVFVRGQFASDADWQAFLEAVRAHVPDANQVRPPRSWQALILVAFVAVVILTALASLVLAFMR